MHEPRYRIFSHENPDFKLRWPPTELICDFIDDREVICFEARESRAVFRLIDIHHHQ
jgi:hypothetical protein